MKSSGTKLKREDRILSILHEALSLADMLSMPLVAVKVSEAIDQFFMAKGEKRPDDFYL